MAYVGTKPKLTYVNSTVPIGGVVYRATNQTGLASGANTKVLYDTNEYNPYSLFPSAGRFEPGILGVYAISAAVRVAPSSGAETFSAMLPSISKNGSGVKSTLHQYLTLAGTSQCLNICAAYLQISLTTDYFEIFMLCNTTGSGTWIIEGSQQYTWLSVSKCA